MATRTYKLLGKCFSSTGTTGLTVAFNGTTVYNGSVPSDAPQPSNQVSHDALIELCTFTASTDVNGNVPLTISTTGGDCIFSGFLGNYKEYNARWLADQTREVIDPPETIFSKICRDVPAVDVKYNVRIDAVDVTATVNLADPEHPWNTTGWHYNITSGSTLTCDYYIDPAEIILEVPQYPPGNTYPYPG